MEEKIQNILAKLNANNMPAQFVKTKADALEIVKNMIAAKSTVGYGGAKTLAECGILDMLRNGEYSLLDWARADLDEHGKEDIYHKNYTADYYLSSTNALTENGELYNVDGRNNRVSAIGYGPKNVIIVAGKNKIVRDIDEAVYRVKTICAPKNAARLNYNSYCKTAGICSSLKNAGTDYANHMTEGCRSKERICCNYSVMGFQRIAGRISVIIVDEVLGF